MLEKMVTTKMSANKKKLQNRFFKIRSENGKMSKITAIAFFAVIIISVISFSLYLYINKERDSISDNAELKLVLNGLAIEFDNEPYVLSEKMSDGYTRQIMAYFPLEELVKKTNYLSSVETKDNKTIINLSGAMDIYEIETDKKEINYRGKNNEINSRATRTTSFAPVLKNNMVYIPYEFVEYLWIDANNYDLSGSALYKNEEMNIQFELPLYWLGKYIADERSADENIIYFRHKNIADKYEGYGSLFSVIRLPDSEINENMNNTPNQTVVWRNKEYGYLIGRPTDVQQPIFEGSDKEDIRFLDEYERMRKTISHIESTFNLIKEDDIPVITNGENMSYAEIMELQRQVDNGHFMWRLDYDQVIKAHISGQGYDAEAGGLISFFGDSEKVSGVYVTGNVTHKIELYKPIEKSEKGIWIVRSCKLIEAAEIKEVIFHNLKRTDNRASSERVVKREDGWYNLYETASAFINFDGAVPETVVAKFTPAGTEMEEYEKEVGIAAAPFEQIPLTIDMQFEKDDTLGHLQFEFHYRDGRIVYSELFNVLIGH